MLSYLHSQISMDVPIEISAPENDIMSRSCQIFLYIDAILAR